MSCAGDVALSAGSLGDFAACLAWRMFEAHLLTSHRVACCLPREFHWLGKGLIRRVDQIG